MHADTFYQVTHQSKTFTGKSYLSPTVIKDSKQKSLFLSFAHFEADIIREERYYTLLDGGVLAIRNGACRRRLLKYPRRPMPWPYIIGHYVTHCSSITSRFNISTPESHDAAVLITLHENMIISVSRPLLHEFA